MKAARNSTLASYKPLRATADADDRLLHRRNSSCPMVTRRLRELVPLLDFVGCTVERVSKDNTVLSVPLRAGTTNQNATHQGSVFYLLADYALGVAMFSVLPGTYVTGIHDRCNAQPVKFWLKRGSVRHLASGTGTIRAEVSIPEHVAGVLREQLVSKGRAELQWEVKIFQGDALVAIAEHVMGIYVDKSQACEMQPDAGRIENLKTSALMIAGLRCDERSKVIAGERGEALARRMTALTPQLPSLIQARTLDLSKFLNAHRNRDTQVVSIGVGLDVKPCEFSGQFHRWYGLDLRRMLQERKRLFADNGNEAQGFVPVAANMNTRDWGNALIRAGFDRSRPTIVVMEGLSMYLEQESVRSTIRQLSLLARNSQMSMWFDHVTPEVFHADLPAVRDFLATMSRLGEPFVSGFEDPQGLVGKRWHVDSTTSAATVLGSDDPVHALYRFSVIQLKRCSAEFLGTTPHRWFDRAKPADVGSGPRRRGHFKRIAVVPRVVK